MDDLKNRQAAASMLVVDDEPRNRKLLEGYLRAEGYHVRGAPDGPTALAMVKEELPDVILLDVMMPVMTGYDVCQIIKQDSQSRMCQVMMVTALAATTDKVAGLDTGADDYVTKPVRREEFLAKVRALLRVRRLLGELDQMRAEVAARNEELQLKKTLAQTLVHDLKSPLAAVLGNLDLLRMRADQPLHYLIERSKQGASRMLKMILNLLDVEKLEDGRFRPEACSVDAVGLAGAAVDEARVLAERHEIKLELDVPNEAWVRGDESMLRRMLDNLLSNAIAHSPVKGTVEITVCPRPEGIEFSVSDEGPGVPEDFREQVFEKYTQVDAPHASRAANRGLGLTFCRLAVEAHGGAIWIDQAPGGGACFRAVLPDASPGETSNTESIAAGV